MTLAAIISLIGVVIAGGLTALMRQWKIGPFLHQEQELEDFSTLPPVPLPEAPILPPEPPSPPISPKPPVMDFSTPKTAWHAVRVLCDEMGATYGQKDTICGMVYQESRFLKGAIGKPNKNGTRDYGIAQFNNGTLKGVPLWIGKGATFASIDEVLNNPEKCMRVMIRTCLAGHWNWWMSFSEGSYKQWLLPQSPMWLLSKP